MKSIIVIFFSFTIVKAQPKYPIPLLIDGVRYMSLPNNVNLNDTFVYNDGENSYYRFVIFDPKGKSYFEIFKKNRLFAKGYFENSLDTLKAYSLAISPGGEHSKIEVLQYFQPLKNGLWIELVKDNYVKRRYNMGIEE